MDLTGFTVKRFVGGPLDGKFGVFNPNGKAMAYPEGGGKTPRRWLTKEHAQRFIDKYHNSGMDADDHGAPLALFEEAAVKPKKAPGKDNALVAYLRGKGLSRELARKAYNYLLNDVPRTNVADYIGRSLSEMFYFGDTKEGFDFWSRTNSKHFGNA